MRKTPTFWHRGVAYTPLKNGLQVELTVVLQKKQTLFDTAYTMLAKQSETERKILEYLRYNSAHFPSDIFLSRCNFESPDKGEYFGKIKVYTVIRYEVAHTAEIYDRLALLKNIIKRYVVEATGVPFSRTVRCGGKRSKYQT